MTAPYQQIVRDLRRAFPQPVSDPTHDAYFAFSVLRTLDRVDAMKSVSPLLGEPIVPDYERARAQRIADEPSTVERVTARLVDHLSGMFIWGHPRAQINVVPPPTIPSIIGGLIPSIYNPNLVSEESSRQVAVSEVEAAAITAALVGYDPHHSAGLFTFGGTATTLYGVRIGLEKALPGSMRHGLASPAVVVCSDRAHYAAHTVCGWLGLGYDQLVQVPTDLGNEILPCLAETICRDQLKQGRRIAAIIATMGTTDAFGVDDLQALSDMRDRLVDEFSLDYVPHLHADAVIGWAWSVFNDYDFDVNPLGFRGRTVRALAGVRRKIRHLNLADSIGIDFHKTGFTPYISSLFLTRDARALQLIARSPETMPYLFQSGDYHPGQYTLETSRSGAGPLAALANLLLFGKNGLRALLGHIVSMAETLREKLDSYAATHVLNNSNFGPVTLFRVYPDGVDTFSFPELERTQVRFRDRLLAHNEYNRQIFEIIQAEALQGHGVIISLTDCYRESDYGEPIVALKSYILSPFAEEESVPHVLESIWKARARLAAVNPT
ncbi:MAG: aspartate aminotransferase family protein [Planctomycetaceae bacterium]|nr:MAG: aspartate aminotransferase family protein [Planctomycetaceae bacterium]